MSTAQHSVQLTVGTRRVFLAFAKLWAFLRFEGESTLPPTAANASRWAARLTVGVKLDKVIFVGKNTTT
jgi:hypothetical protein